MHFKLKSALRKLLKKHATLNKDYFYKMNIKSLVLEVNQGRKFPSYQEHFKKKPNEIKALFQLIHAQSKYPLQEYASWILAHVSKTQKNEVQKYYRDCLIILITNENQSVRRNILNTMKSLQLMKHKETQFIDLLISFIQNPVNKVATQVYSMQILAEFVFKYPSLKTELIALIELNSKNKTPAYASAFRQFKKITKNI